MRYPTLDKRIEATYAKSSAAQNKNSLYDSYIRAIRWASDRVGSRGIVGFVTNNGYIDSNTAAGLRLALQAEFADLYITDLRGNSRTSGDEAKREGGNVFDIRVGVAICFLVKDTGRRDHGLHFWAARDRATKAEKIEGLKSIGVEGLDFMRLTPSPEGDWINLRSDQFSEFTPITSNSPGEIATLSSNTSGVKTNRDAWVYNSSSAVLQASVAKLQETYVAQLRNDPGIPLTLDPGLIAWGGALKSLAERRIPIDPPDWNEIRTATYRPFNKANLYFSDRLNERRYRLPAVFVGPNEGFYYVGMGSTVPFSVLMTDDIPDLHVTGAGSGGQFFARHRYINEHADHDQLPVFDSQAGHRRVSNVTDEILADYRATFGADVSKDDIFDYVYGILHSPDYRTRFAADLKKMLPRIPKVRDFAAFRDAGRQLGTLHMDYESVPRHPGLVVSTSSTTGGEPSLLVKKMRYAGTRPNVDKTTIVYNDDITISGIPIEAHEYMLGSRSALDWILERYQVKIDPASKIVNDANAWGLEHGNPRYILDLIGSIVTVSLETVRIVKSLPPLDILDERQPSTS